MSDPRTTETDLAGHDVDHHADYDVDPLAGLPQSPFTDLPATAEEARLRQHIANFVLTALDRTEPMVERENAARHALICDPARAMGLLIQVGTGAIETIEAVEGHAPGAAIAELRANLHYAETAERAQAEAERAEAGREAGS
jgi:hypothetical protein